MQEIKAAFETRSPAERTALERMVRDSSTLNPDMDSPELEGELLQVIDGSYTPHPAQAFLELGERIILLNSKVT